MATVEQERIEFKSRNPEAVLHTVGAFANDSNHWGGGHLFIGISFRGSAAAASTKRNACNDRPGKSTGSLAEALKWQ